MTWEISQMILNGYDVWADDYTDEPDNFDDSENDNDGNDC